MVMPVTVTEVLNIWNDLGVFSYVIPFLLIFAIVYAILERSKILGENKAIRAIVGVAVGLLSLQFDFVSDFYSVIFPRFGVGLSIFLVVLIMIGFFYPATSGKYSGKIVWIGWVVGIGVALWSFSSWDEWSSYMGFGGWFSEYIWSIIILAALITIIVLIAHQDKGQDKGG